jgi:TctA family transporter
MDIEQTTETIQKIDSTSKYSTLVGIVVGLIMASIGVYFVFGEDLNITSDDINLLSGISAIALGAVFMIWMMYQRRKTKELTTELEDNEIERVASDNQSAITEGIVGNMENPDEEVILLPVQHPPEDPQFIFSSNNV